MLVIIIGRMGKGKTTLAEYLAQRFPTVVKFDPRNQVRGGIVMTDPEGLYDLLDEEQQAGDVRQEIIVRPGMEQDVSECFDQTCKEFAMWIQDNPEEDVCLFADEARIIGLDERNISRYFSWIIRSSREGSHVNVIITCHRPVDVNTNIRAIVERWCMFAVTLENDLEVIGAQCGEGVREKVFALQGRQFVIWDDSRSKYRVETNSDYWNISRATKIERTIQNGNADNVTSERVAG